MVVRKFKIGKMYNPGPVLYIVLYCTQELIIQRQGDIRKEIQDERNYQHKTENRRKQLVCVKFSSLSYHILYKSILCF